MIGPCRQEDEIWRGDRHGHIVTLDLSHGIVIRLHRGMPRSGGCMRPRGRSGRVTAMLMPTIAAIDVGTNAMRLVIGSVHPDHRIDLLENIREPVRLGKDVFARGSISEETTERAIEAFQKFKRLIDKYGVEHIKAVATSATREALNSDIFIDRIAQATGIDIATIAGEEEARLIHLAVADRVNLRNKRAILIDIGGGSVEVTLVSHGSILATVSFNMGTGRLLQKLGQEKVGEQRF